MSGRGWFTAISQKLLIDELILPGSKAKCPTMINEESGKLLKSALDELVK